MWECSRALVFSYEFLFTAVGALYHYVCLLASSPTYDCTLGHMIPHFLTTYSFIMDRVYLGALTLVWFSLLSLCPDGQHWIGVS
jgi:hypothetical protein